MNLHNLFRIEYAKYNPGKHLITIHGPMPMTGSLFTSPSRKKDNELFLNAIVHESKPFQILGENYFFLILN